MRYPIITVIRHGGEYWAEYEAHGDPISDSGRTSDEAYKKLLQRLIIMGIAKPVVTVLTSPQCA